MQYRYTKSILERSFRVIGERMNKLMGFLELKEMRLPSVPWRRYTGKEELRDDVLWTIRSAVYRGNDLNLPRLVGENSEKAKVFADKLLSKMGENGIVIFYPYFVAKKSGTLCVGHDKIIIEAVKDDLWNLVTYSEREVTLIISNESTQIIGNGDFLSEDEVDELKKHVFEIKKVFRNDILEGKNVLLEWSFACSCDKDRKMKDDEQLVFYEVRTI